MQPSTRPPAVRRRLLVRLASPVGLLQPPDQGRPERPVILAVDQKLASEEWRYVGGAPN